MMVGGYLRLRFLDDSDGTGKLVAHAESKGFSGDSGAYFSKVTLEDFATKLRAFPLPDRPAIAGGFYSKERREELEQEHLAIACYPLDAQGHLGVQVRMSTELWRPARPESQFSVTLEISTSYEPLRQFSYALLALLHGIEDEAVLDGE